MPRPTKYDPVICDTIVEIGRQGGDILQMMAAIGITSYDTWYRWKDKHPEFKEAAEYAQLVSAAYTSKIFQKHCEGEIKGDGKGLMWTLYNKAPKIYNMPGRPVSEGNTQINIGSINSVKKLDSKSLDENIQQTLKKLQLLGDEDA